MNLITNLLTIQNQMRVFHWQTQKKPGSFAQHQAFGTAYEDLDPLSMISLRSFKVRMEQLWVKMVLLLNL